MHTTISLISVTHSATIEFSKATDPCAMASVDCRPVLLRSDSSFYLQLVNPQFGTLAHGDCAHLNVDGARRLEQLFRRYVYDEVVCVT
jgi:hypothetical protein